MMKKVLPVLLFASASVFALEPYAKLRTDFSKDTSGNLNDTTGERPSSVKGVQDETLSANVRASYFGVNSSLQFGDVKLDGKIEIDFYGDASSSNVYSLNPQVTYAYANAYLQALPGEAMLFLGLTDDVISPLWPSTLNYAGNWYSGNTGDTRPQVGIDYGFSWVKLQASVARAATGRENSGFDYEGRVSLNSPKSMENMGFSLGYGYLKAEERRTVSGTGTNGAAYSWFHDHDIALQVVDFSFRWKNAFVFQAEYYKGTNARDYGTLSSFDTMDLRGVSEKGYWADVQVNYYKPINFYLGYSLADVDQETVSAYTDLTVFNETSWIGLEWMPYEPVGISLEYARNKTTDQIGINVPGVNLHSERYTLSFSYKI